MQVKDLLVRHLAIQVKVSLQLLLSLQDCPDSCCTLCVCFNYTLQYLIQGWIPVLPSCSSDAPIIWHFCTLPRHYCTGPKQTSLYDYMLIPTDSMQEIIPSSLDAFAFQEHFYLHSKQVKIPQTKCHVTQNQCAGRGLVAFLILLCYCLL